MTPSRLTSSIVPLLVLCLTLSACGGGTSATSSPDVIDGGESDVDDGSDIGDTPADVTEDASGIEPLAAWPAQVTIFPFLDDQTFEGDIADGEIVDMGWADEPGVYCWLPNITHYFTGSQVYYAMDKPLQKASQLTITVTPNDPAVDLNVYAFGLDLGIFYFPPLVPAVSDCQSSRSAGPGESETLYLQNLQEPLEWLIAVSGPEGVTEGAFTLTIDRADLMGSP